MLDAIEPTNEACTKAKNLAQSVFLIRGEKVMLDVDLATLYGVRAKALNQAFRRNKQRLPSDFAFQLSKEEFDRLRSQIVTSSLHGGRRYRPHAFTEQGVAMLSSVLRSTGVVEVTSRSCVPSYSSAA
jgi:hypothetical protein